MKPALLNILACPECGGALQIQDEMPNGAEIEQGRLKCAACQKSYPIINGIPRFVPEENYASSFGYQWNMFRKTQLDSNSGIPISRDRFLSYSGWSPESLKGKTVLDVGCGAGRFTEVALSFGAHVVAVDYSSAVDACWENMARHPNLNVVQGDIYQLPFVPGSFDFVFCFGVLQHTPFPERSFKALLPQVKAGGRLSVDVYPKLLRNLFWSKYWFRPITRRLSPEKLFRIVPRLVRILLPISKAVGRLPLVGKPLKYAIPVVNYEGEYPLSEAQLEEWSILDTFDMLSPQHDHPQSFRTLERWFSEADLKDSEVFRMGFYVGRGTR